VIHYVIPWKLLLVSLKHSVPDDTNMFVKTVKSGSKKDFCIYCQTEQSKLSCHLNKKHKDVKEIKDIFVFPKDDQSVDS